MSGRIPTGSIILTPTEANILYSVARLGDLRSKYRNRDSVVYRLLREITDCAFSTDAVSGNELRQPAASEKAWYTTQSLARKAGLAPRTIRLACENGELPAEKPARTWLIRTDDAMAYIAARRKT